MLRALTISPSPIAEAFLQPDGSTFGRSRAIRMLTVGYRMGILLEILRASHQSEYLTAFSTVSAHSGHAVRSRVGRFSREEKHDCLQLTGAKKKRRSMRKEK
jgi:hypothetical protein